MGFLDKKGSKRETLLGNYFAKFMNYCIILFAIYLVYSIIYAHPHRILYRSTFLSVMCAITMIYYTFPGEKPNKVRVIDYILSTLSLIVAIYIVLNGERYVFRIQFYDEVYIFDMIAGIVMILLTLEATRRTLGWPLTIICVIVLSYCYLGKYVQGIFAHRGFKLSQIIDQLFMSTSGIYGLPTGIASTFVFMFVLFGAFLNSTGGGDFFYNLSVSIAGHRRGGLAKTAIIASSLFGTISGSPTSNVATTGTFTIPMMKRLGYPSYFAAAVETVASCGGCIMPPVMGTVAFVMADVIGVPYYKVVIAAIFPALLYYGALFYSVDVEAIKRNLQGLDKLGLPSVWKTLIGGIRYIIPLGWLVFRLFRGFSPARVAFEAIMFMLVISFIKKGSRYSMNIKNILNGLEKSVKVLLPIAAACSSAGLIVGVINLTGAGGKFSSVLLGLAHGNLFLAFLTFFLVSKEFYL